MTKEIDRTMKRLLKLMQKEKIIGKNMGIGKYYMAVNITKIKKKCKSCGQLIE